MTLNVTLEGEKSTYLRSVVGGSDEGQRYPDPLRILSHLWI